MGRVRKERGARNFAAKWETGIDCFDWWMEDGVVPGQMEFEVEGDRYDD